MNTRDQRKRTYIWTREFSLERLAKIEQLNRCWENLFDEPGDRGHYARFQWLGNGWNGVHTSRAFSGWIDSDKSQIHLRVITAREWLARLLYGQALQQTYARYPNFDQHEFFDGPRVGERCIEFLSETYEMAGIFLWNSLWLTARDNPPLVRESMFVEPCTDWGYAQTVALAKRYGNNLGAGHKRITIISNKESISNDDVEALQRVISEGGVPELDPTPISIGFDDIREGFIELSGPELTALNWVDARIPLADQDRELLKAVDAFDHEGIEKALSLGANLNLIDEDGETALTRAMDAWYSLREYWQASDADLAKWGQQRPQHELTDKDLCDLVGFLIDAGAHPDLHGPCEAPLIVNASLACRYDLMKLLLERGANSAVQWAWDSYPGEWPQAWDSPSFDAFNEHDAEARKVYDLLVLSRPSPNHDKKREEGDIQEARANLGFDPTWS